jgi:hypothetical protein
MKVRQTRYEVQLVFLQGHHHSFDFTNEVYRLLVR